MYLKRYNILIPNKTLVFTPSHNYLDSKHVTVALHPKKGKRKKKEEKIILKEN